MFEALWTGHNDKRFMPVALLSLLLLYTMRLNLLCYTEQWSSWRSVHWDSVLPLCLASSNNRLPLFDRPWIAKARTPRRSVVFCFGGLKFGIDTLMSARSFDTLTVLLPKVALHHQGSGHIVEFLKSVDQIEFLEF